MRSGFDSREEKMQHPENFKYSKDIYLDKEPVIFACFSVPFPVLYTL